MKDHIEDFRLQYQVYHGLSDRWARDQRTRVTEFAEESGPMTYWTGEHFQLYLARRMDDGLHPNTVRKYANQLRAFFGWAYATSRLTADQYLQLKSVGNPRGSSAHSEPNPYTKAELQQFWADLDAAHPVPDNIDVKVSNWLKGRSRWRNVWVYAMKLQIEAIVALALHCGLRRQEIYNLTPDELHYDNEYVVVVGKGGKTRAVPYTSAARESVRKWLEFRTLIRPTHGKTWLSLYGRAWNLPMSFDRLEELLQARVGDYQLHRFRHTYATERLRAGTPLEIVSKALGHATTQQTLAYAKIAKGDIHREMARSEAAFEKAVQRRAA